MKRCLLPFLLLPFLSALAQNARIVKSEFIYETAPFPSCHASTLAETPEGLVTAWFGGTRERHPDVGIWVSRQTASGWTSPVEVANGVQTDGKRYPTWNPVLFQYEAGPLVLFYKVGPNPKEWWGMQMTSADGGRTWTKPERLPDGIAGPIKNKPELLASGKLLCPSSTEDNGWRLHMESTTDKGKSWKRTEALNTGTGDQGAIQPSLLRHPGGRLQLVCRATNGWIQTAWSDDEGEHWTPLENLALPNPNSGIDAVTLKNGQHLLVYNHVPTEAKKWGSRSPLNVAVSTNGKDWSPLVELENERGAEFSYPAVIQTKDGLIHFTYTWKRQRIKHVVLQADGLAAEKK